MVAGAFVTAPTDRPLLFFVMLLSIDFLPTLQRSLPPVGAMSVGAGRQFLGAESYNMDVSNTGD